jgi:hypothetical protein
MSGVSQSEDRMLSRSEREIEQLSTPDHGASTYPVTKGDGAVRVLVSQDAHGFERGDPVYCVAGVWALLDGSYGVPALQHASLLWGIVDRVSGVNRLSVIVSGEARIPGATLTPGNWYSFDSAGAPVELFTTSYPPPGASSHYFAVKATRPDRVLVVNDSRIDGLASHTGTFTTVSHASIGIGHYVVYRGCPSGEVPLALADEANPWKWTHVGIALFEVGSAGTWLVLIDGENTWYDYDNGDTRPAWMTTPPYNVGQRVYLSDTNPGQYAATEPAFKVHAGRSSASYTPASPPNPEATTFSASAVSQGVPYPIPASGGGTGMDVSALTEHSVLFVDTYGSPATRKVAGIVSATSSPAFLTQSSGGFPTFTAIDDVANGSLEVIAGVVYAKACGKLFDTVAPTNKQFLRYNGTKWAPVGPLLTALGQTLGHDGTDLVTVDCSTGNSVIGRSAASAGAFAPIVAGAANRILAMGATAVAFSDDPVLTRGGVDFKLCTVATITTSTTAPSASGVKGQMHFVY